MTEITHAAIERDATVGVTSRTPRRRWILVAGTVGTAAAITLAAVAVVGGPADRSATAFAVEVLPAGNVAVKIVDSDVSARAMTDQLHAAGLDVTVATMPASPQLVGHWVAASYTDTVPAAISDAISKQTTGYVATIEIPRNVNGGVRLTVGVQPQTGQAPTVVGQPNALAPGGIFGCQDLSGAKPIDLSSTLASQGYRVVWRTSLTSQVTAPTAPAGTRVTAVFVSDDAPRTATVLVTAPADARFVGQLQLGYPLSQRTPTGVDFSACGAAR